jgi:hypothetical protein
LCIIFNCRVPCIWAWCLAVDNLTQASIKSWLLGFIVYVSTLGFGIWAHLLKSKSCLQQMPFGSSPVPNIFNDSFSKYWQKCWWKYCTILILSGHTANIKIVCSHQY